MYLVHQQCISSEASTEKPFLRLLHQSVSRIIAACCLACDGRGADDSCVILEASRMLALAVVVGLVALFAWMFRGEVLYWAESLVNSAAGDDDP